uniref:Capsid protein n=1 Tax=Cryptotermes secundus trichomonasvirus 2 TaxID=3133528 RepID=A0AAT9JQ82_9VIRU
MAAVAGPDEGPEHAGRPPGGHDPPVAPEPPPVEPAVMRPGCASAPEIFEALRQVVMPGPIRKQNGQAMFEHNLTYADTRDLVVRFELQVTSATPDLANQVKQAHIMVDIGMADDSVTLCDVGRVPLSVIPMQEAAKRTIAGILHARKVRFLDHPDAEPDAIMSQRIHVLPWILGVWRALMHRLSALNMTRARQDHRGAGVTLLYDDLLFNGIGHGANACSLAGQQSGVFVRENVFNGIHGRGLVNTCCGIPVLPWEAYNGAFLPNDVIYIYATPQLLATEIFQDMCSVLYALLCIIDWDGMHVPVPEIHIMIPGNAAFAQVNPRAAGQITRARMTAAFSYFNCLVNSAFEGNKGIYWKYLLAGNGALLRPHASYSEGGVIRKAFRHVPIGKSSGLILAGPPGVRPSFPDLIEHNACVSLSLVSLAETMMLQSILSIDGPLTVDFRPQQLADVAPAYDRGIYLGGNTWTCLNNAQFAVRNAYGNVLSRPHIVEALRLMCSNFYPTGGNEIADMLIQVGSTTQCTLSNSKRRRLHMRHNEGNHNARFRFAIGFLNRFHDSELAYILGIPGNGIKPINGIHEENVVEAVMKIFEGDDLRNHPVVLHLRENGLDNFAELAEEDMKQPVLIRADGMRVPINRFTRLGELLAGWREHNGLCRPYSAMYECAFGLSMRAVRPGSVRAVYTVVSVLKTRVSYKHVTGIHPHRGLLARAPRGGGVHPIPR